MASQKHNLVIKNRPSSETSKLDPQEQYLPIANVSRIMKKSLPENAKISKEAKETVQECVSEFISFITGEASDKCLREKRKTINGEDLLWSMATLGFESYVGTLKVYLNKHKQNEGDHHEDANMARQEYANLDSLHTDAAEKVKVDHLDNDGYYGDDEVGVEVISSKRLKGVNNLNFDLGNNYGGDIFNPAEFAGRRTI